MTDSEWRTEFIRGQFARSLRRISDLNELIETIAGEWKNLKLTCECDPDKQ